VKRGEVWTRSRLGHESAVVIVGNDSLTVQRSGVLTVPISDVMPPTLLEPTVSDADGTALGVALIPRVGEVSKANLSACASALSPASMEAIDVALRAALAL
jgi:mRNA-degrading endonuclease toxin of MazEF toxin-antitoxin module